MGIELAKELVSLLLCRLLEPMRKTELLVYWLLGSSVRKIDNSNFHHPHIFLGHVVLNHQRNIEIFLRLWDRIPVASSSPYCEIPKKLQPHLYAILT